MFQRAKQLKAKQQAAAKARSKRANPLNRASSANRIEARADIRAHVTRENEQFD